MELVNINLIYILTTRILKLRKIEWLANLASQ